MELTKDTGTWLKFFKDAGIPTKTGASYAHIFVENRISKDMLSDLTVDHLRLMGITLIGDVIAILRHAKSVHQDSLRKVVILKSKDDAEQSSSSSSSSRSDSSSSSSSSSSSDSDHDVEMVEITNPTSKKLSSSAGKASQPTLKEESQSPTETIHQVRSKVINNTPSTSSSKSITGSERKGMDRSPKTEFLEIIERQLAEKMYFPELSTNTGRSVMKAPTAKNIRILAENEFIGSERKVMDRSPKTEFLEIIERQLAEKSYISELSTNTGRSVMKAPTAKKIRILAENEFIGPKLPPPKKTVFDRLGAETSSPQVSSTTEVSKPEVETTFTRTISNMTVPNEPVKIIANIDIPPPKSSSVFNRLGSVTSDSPRPKSGPTLQYAGVLKSPTAVKRPIQNIFKKVGTMRADEPEVPVKLRAVTNTLVEKNIKIRVGNSPIQNRLKTNQIRRNVEKARFTNPASEGIFANPKNALHLSAKERLGLQNKNNAWNKGVKDRLGVQSNSAKSHLVRQANQRIRRPSPMLTRHHYSDEEDYVESVGTKKVSFGRVDRRFISPMRSSRDGRNMKSGIQSRLGPRRFT